MAFYSETNITTEIDENGKEVTTKKELIKNIEGNNEPDYIKIYTKMWCEFNQIPLKYRDLFLALAMRMSYASIDKTGDIINYGGQLVNTGVPWRDDIIAECGWTSAVSLKKGLKALCDCNAIKRIARGVYQINPSYAGRGHWKYNPKQAQGGIENLITTFNFKNQTVNTQILFATDDEDALEGTGADELIVSRTTKTPA